MFPLSAERPTGSEEGRVPMRHRHSWVNWNRWLRYCTACFKVEPFKVEAPEGGWL